MDRLSRILLNAIPVLLMVSLIPSVKNEYLLTAICIAVIAVSLTVKYEKKDDAFLVFGFLAMLVLESFFISTGVETFDQKGLFGIMPLWLPFLWAYGFVAIKRSINILR
jgi:hypothetical protein